MPAFKNDFFNEASDSIFQLNADEQVRKRCRSREEYYQDLRNYERAIAQRNADFVKLAFENEQMAAKITQLTADINN